MLSCTNSKISSMACPVDQVCITAGCLKPASLQCPTCLKLNILGSFFCSQVSINRKAGQVMVAMICPLPSTQILEVNYKGLSLKSVHDVWKLFVVKIGAWMITWSQHISLDVSFFHAFYYECVCDHPYLFPFYKMLYGVLIAIVWDTGLATLRWQWIQFLVGIIKQ